jgi:ribosomal protein S18 acetylase RimI-like enzyme
MVAVSHRRRGVGTALLDAAVAWAREAVFGKLELHVFPWNEPALGLYETFGFEREGYRKRHYERGGELVDAILMAYFVEPARNDSPAVRARGQTGRRRVRCGCASTMSAR